MIRLQRSPLLGCVFALGLTSAALLVSQALRPYLGPDVYLLFLAAVWASAWYYGLAVGLVDTAISATALRFFFFADAGGGWAIGLRLASFIAISAVIVWMTVKWRENRRVLASTLAAISDAMLSTDIDGRITMLNPVAESITGWGDTEARRKPVEDVLRLFDERTRRSMENPLIRALREGVAVNASEHVMLTTRGGGEVPLELSAAPVRGDSGELRGAILIFRDVSKRRELEEQALHAQKMDAVSRLAGGVAGDFNNMLTVIAGYAELLRGATPEGSATRKFVDEIVYAGTRAASLTRHLLAFSRGTSVQPVVLDLNAMLSEMEPMLRRLLGQHIELVLLLAPGLGQVRADPPQLEQVMVNLAENARDAMPNGGRLVVETANVELEEQTAERLGLNPGPCVMLAVTDNGVGMDPATRSHVFEPLFTTKAPGEGAGLGLSTVYGVIRQAAGQVTVYSQPDCGTIFEVYLPRVMEPAIQHVTKRPLAGSETILLVDDEEGVRRLCAAVLQANGYTVLEAESAQSALATYEKNAHKVDLLLTDLVMRQTSGFELASTLAERNPALKILYMSGYREALRMESGQALPTILNKPFTPEGLLTRVREVLDTDAA